jgi:hypothetical protein
MVYVRPDEARCRGAGYPCNAPGIAVRIPAISTITLKFQFSALAQTHPEQKRSLPRLECTLENVWPRRTREQKALLPRLECTLDSCTLENVWPRRTREHKALLPRSNAPWSLAPWRMSGPDAPGSKRLSYRGSNAPWRIAPRTHPRVGKEIKQILPVKPTTLTHPGVKVGA